MHSFENQIPASVCSPRSRLKHKTISFIMDNSKHSSVSSFVVYNEESLMLRFFLYIYFQNHQVILLYSIVSSFEQIY
jgi:hypothetical protein